MIKGTYTINCGEEEQIPNITILLHFENWHIVSYICLHQILQVLCFRIHIYLFATSVSNDPNNGVNMDSYKSKKKYAFSENKK